MDIWTWAAVAARVPMEDRDIFDGLNEAHWTLFFALTHHQGNAKEELGRLLFFACRALAARLIEESVAAKSVRVGIAAYADVYKTPIEGLYVEIGEMVKKAGGLK